MFIQNIKNETTQIMKQAEQAGSPNISFHTQTIRATCLGSFSSHSSRKTAQGVPKQLNTVSAFPPHAPPSFRLPLYRSSTSSYAWANCFSWEWFVGSRPGMNPAIAPSNKAPIGGRPADYRSGPDPAPSLLWSPNQQQPVRA